MSDHIHNHSRRSFLGTTAVAGAAALGLSAAAGAAKPRKPLLPTVKAGRAPKLGANEPIRMGVIGTGGMGTGHCHAFCNFAEKGTADVQLVAIADVCDERRMNAHRACVEKQNGMEVMETRDYKKLLARDDIHGVLIASPEHWHAQHIIDALHAGKDVYTEKPMTLRLDQAMAVRKAVESHPERIFQVGTQMIMLPKYQEARKAIKAGKIGTPIWSQTSYCRNTPSGEWNYYGINKEWEPGVNLDWNAWLGHLGPREWDPKVYARWRRYRDFSTGIVGDLLVHVMTPMIFALDAGWPVNVVATGTHMIDKDMENHDQVNLTVVFENGHTMVIAGATNNEVGLETLIRGNKANMYLNGRHCDIRPERAYVDEIEREEVTCPDIGNDQDQLRLNWLESIRSRTPALSNIDLASKVLVAVDLATRSMWDGHAYKFDAKTLQASAVK
ncbi:MAG: Gfo/Idh/MocA family oxidoreductase [Phycisphaeraceae bacterium]|nr:Gfo/Idh/MocA family oxidoreductase [Phycisphaerales bacterium]MCB9860675.1 Gfo/Idh/MocA family oxidoreductase [Phycisphaeraceae bacterium]